MFNILFCFKSKIIGVLALLGFVSKATVITQASFNVRPSIVRYYTSMLSIVSSDPFFNFDFPIFFFNMARIGVRTSKTPLLPNVKQLL